MMGFMHRLFRSRWVRTLVGVLILGAIIWVFGPLLGIGAMHPFDSELARGIAIAVLLVLWLIENLIHELRMRGRDKALVAGVAAPQDDTNATASAEELALLSDRLKEALAARCPGVKYGAVEVRGIQLIPGHNDQRAA